MAAELQNPASLAGVVEEIGYGCSTSEAVFSDILKQFDVVDEPAVARVLGVMLKKKASDSGTQTPLALTLAGIPTDGTAQSKWNVGAVISSLKSNNPGLQPQKVIEALDNEDFIVEDAAGLLLLTSAWKEIAGEAPFPLEAVIGDVWEHSAGQLSLLRQAVLAPPDIFTFKHASEKVPPLEGLQAGKSPLGTPNEAWLCISLYKILSRLAEAGHNSAVHQMLDQPLRTCPEVLCVGLASTSPTNWGVLHREICQGLIMTFIKVDPNSSLVMSRVWPANGDLVVHAMLSLHKQEEGSISRILDICEELKALTTVLNSAPFNFAIELAALAARREYMNIETWLQDRISFHRLPFLMAIIQFLGHKIQGQQVANAQPVVGGHSGQTNLSLETLAIFLRVLEIHSQGGPPEVVAEISQLKNQALLLHPELHILIIEAAATSSVPAPAASFPADIEEEANAYFQKLYAEEDPESIESLIAKLSSMKSGDNAREQKIFQCMIQSLFDEYRFFHKYPDKELQTTAALFGGLINSNLIVDESLGEALRLFLDALRSPPNHKMSNFGLQALHTIVDRLPAWPQYCRNLLQVANLRDADSELAGVVLRVVSDFAGGHAPPPGFEQPPGGALGESSALQAEAATGVQLAEQALEEPAGAPSLAAAAAAAASAELATLPQASQPDQGLTAGTALPLSEDAPIPSAAEEQASEDLSSTAQSNAQPHLPGSPRLPGSSIEDQARPANTATQSAMDHRRAFQTVNAETLELASQNVDYDLPPHKVQDRIGFLINNLSNSNLDQKSKELKELLAEEYWPWFCNYMVVKRAAQEQNFHVLYASLLNALQIKELWRMLVLTAYKYIKILLASERIKTQSSERSLLKNLGSWLGRITIAQGQPVKHKDLDVKGIIIEAYEQGKMIAVLPFVNKVLEPCKDSKVFRPPNPWISGILSLMAEIYHTEKLKLHLTFEIEMLFRNFNLQISDTRVSKELVNRKRDLLSGTDYTVEKPPPEVTGPPISPARSVPGVSDSSARTPGSAPRAGPPSVDGSSQISGATAATGASHVQGLLPDQGLIGNYHNHVQINAKLQPVAERLGLKRMVPVAVDRAVSDIITPVVERSVTIACMTTQELILKDFATESDEGRMRKAAHLMVSSLAGSLALVTCREPLRSSLAAQMRHLLANTMDLHQLEQTVQIITSDNFELGCTIIEKSATDKAVRDINDRLASALQLRQKPSGAGPPYFDMGGMLPAGFPHNIPEAMRPKAGQLSPQQQRVYEDFARIPRAPTAAPAGGAGMHSLGPGSPPKSLQGEKVTSSAPSCSVEA